VELFHIKEKQFGRKIGNELVLKGKIFPSVQRFYPNTAIFST
jgi:hypothetical protein